MFIHHEAVEPYLQRHLFLHALHTLKLLPIAGPLLLTYFSLKDQHQATLSKSLFYVFLRMA